MKAIMLSLRIGVGSWLNQMVARLRKATPWQAGHYLLITVYWLLVTSSSAQGPLAPPGAPAPTMKTLDQVEPRIAITNIPATISNPGSYYLTASFTGVVGTNGVTITASDVTLDLQGHALVGVPGSADGINVLGARKAIVIRNGIISNWGGDGIDASASGVQSVQVLEVVSVTNGVDGIRVNSLTTVSRCVANDNGGNGIFASGIACLVENCVASENKLDGIFMPTSSKIVNCTARDNFDDGIVIQGGCVVEGCSSVANDNAGIRVTGPGSVIMNCTSTASGTEGISISTKDTYVFNNIFDQNGSAGVSAGILITNALSIGNRLDSNHVTENDIGIQILAVSNLVVRNSVRGSLLGTNYSIVASNSVGNIINVSGAVFTNSNPWANFEF